MKSIATEIYISQDGINYRHLDLYKDEPINIKFILKDSKDPSKIFTPYSLTFKVPASEKNQRAFEFYGDPFVTRTASSIKFQCKIYVDGNLAQTGNVKISSISYNKGVATDYSCNFSSLMASLKERLGDDLITGLDEYDAVKNPNPLVINWDPKSVYQLLAYPFTANSGRVRVPFASTDRVWSYDDSSGSPRLDNIYWKSGLDPRSNSLIKTNELRPALRVGELMRKLISKYDLKVNCPLFRRSEFSNLWVWCMNENFKSNASKLIGVGDFGNPFKVPCEYSSFGLSGGTGFPTNRKWYIAPLTGGSGVRIYFVSSGSSTLSNKAEFMVQLTNVRSSSTVPDTDSIEGTFTFVDKNTGQIYFSEKVGLLDLTDNHCSSSPGLSMKSSMDLTSDMTDVAFGVEIEVYVSFNKPVVWDECIYGLKTYLKLVSNFNEGNICNESVVSNYSTVQPNKVNVYETLPPMKCIDFLTSIFAMFNIAFLDNYLDDYTLDWLTPQDIQGGEFYGTSTKRTLDYTAYLDNTSSSRAPLLAEYNSYNFKHATSKYRSNEDYLAATGIEYGQDKYTLPNEKEPKEYKVETKFSSIPAVTLQGTTIHTYYGFQSGTPSYTDLNEARYTPNYGEFTLFYDFDYVTSSTGGRSIACQDMNSSGDFTVSPVSRINRFLPFTKDSRKSLLFSTYKDDSFIHVRNSILDTELPDNLYKNNYKTQTERALDPNVFKETVSLTLPSNELYSRPDTVSTFNRRPYGFRLQNDIILNEMKYSIEEAQIDQTTGKAKMTLINYV